MKTSKTLFPRLLLVTLIMISSCHEENDVKPDIINTDEPAKTTLTKDDLQPDGVVTETDNGYTVDGKLTIKTDSSAIVLDEADLEVEFNDDGTLRSVSGTAQVPSSKDMFTLENPVRADVNFYTGKYINENFDIEIQLVDDISYFIFYIKVESELNMTVDGKPATLPNPAGAHITLISDFNDPMFFFSVGADVLASVAFGRSYLGQIPFVPTTPTANVITFNAKSVRGAGSTLSGNNNGTSEDNSEDENGNPKSKKKSHKFSKFISAQGMLYENSELGATIDWAHPEESELYAGYRSGLNGALGLSFPGLEFQVAQGSYAVVTEASSKDGIIAKAFFMGVVEPDLSWWPKLIPLKPQGALSLDGYTTSQGDFDFGMAGSFGIEMPDKTEKVEGEMRFSEQIKMVDGNAVTKKSHTMSGKVTKGDEVWGAKATFTDDSTVYIATPPEGFLDGVSSIVNHQVDSAFAVHEKALEDLRKAAENYEFELSLRGLKDVIPGIVDDALDIIDESVDEGIAEGRRRARAGLAEHGRVLCSDNIPSVVNGIVKPYKDALNRLKNAITQTADTEHKRAELEAALKDLIKLKKIDKTVTVYIWNDSKIGNCLIPRKDSRTIRITQTVLSSNYVNQLTQAANNIKYIKEASNIKIKAQKIVNQLPSLEELEALKNNVEGCVAEITQNIGDVGFVKNHKTGKYTYFIMSNGERIEVSGFNVFDSHSVIEISRPEFNACKITD